MILSYYYNIDKRSGNKKRVIVHQLGGLARLYMYMRSYMCVCACVRIL